MRDSFDVGAQGEDLYQRYLERRFKDFDVSIERILDLERQLKGADFRLVHNPSGKVRLDEVKTEEVSKWGNFTFERWSNRSTRRDGCIMTSKATLLIFNFLDTPDTFYRFSMKKVAEWMREQDRLESLGQLDYRFRLKEQRKRVQANDSWNRHPPIDWALENLGGTVIRSK